MKQPEDVKVSVTIFTYNHEKYIRRALESVLAQEVTFSYEVIVCDDASRDETPSILQEFQSKHLEGFRVFFSHQNVGIFQQILRIIPEIRGRYIAIFDGDDEWIEPKKLQHQVDFLEENAEYAGCFHDAEIVHTNSTSSNVKGYFQDYKRYSQFNHFKSDFFPWDVIERNIIPTSSMVVRTTKFPTPEELAGFQEVKYSLIWLLQLMTIRYEKFKYFNETWSIYNNHGGSVTKKNPKSSFIKTNIRILKMLITDEYYRNITHHLYYMLSVEYQNLFFSDDPQFNKTDRLKCMWRFFYYGQLYLFRRMKSLKTSLNE